jgi:hypothetical protein
MEYSLGSKLRRVFSHVYKDGFDMGAIVAQRVQKATGP